MATGSAIIWISIGPARCITRSPGTLRRRGTSRNAAASYGDIARFASENDDLRSRGTADGCPWPGAVRLGRCASRRVVGGDCPRP